MHNKRNPYGYATNEYWQFEAERHGFKSAKDWLESEERSDKINEPPDWDHTETYEDDY